MFCKLLACIHNSIYAWLSVNKFLNFIFVGRAQSSTRQCLRGIFFTLQSCFCESFSLRKQPTFGDATTGFLAKRRVRNKCRNFMLMTCHYPDLGSGSDWLRLKKKTKNNDMDQNMVLTRLISINELASQLPYMIYSSKASSSPDPF